ncbi:MAG: hypothetical protein ACR2Q3_19910 [Woeseiaceae bacterium]
MIINAKIFKRSGMSGLIGLVVVCILAGCAASAPEIRNKLDPSTGVTITYSSVPLIMYREDPAQAAFARNYVHVGPIQVNRSGNYQYFLWLGVWNNMQDLNSTSHRDGLGSIVIFADGEPLSLEISGWTPDAIGTSEPVYLKPVASSADAYYRVTADQIRLIAEATDIRLRTSGAKPREFEPWDGQLAARNDLQEFLRRTLF